jgi:hypothetical protein
VTKRSLLIIFTTINVVFIGAQVYKHTRMTHLRYVQSGLLAEQQKLEHDAELLRQQICAHKDIGHIKKYAQDELHMKPLPLNRVKRINL